MSALAAEQGALDLKKVIILLRLTNFIVFL